MPAQRRDWSRDELMLAFRLYCRTPFGRLHQHNPDIIALAALISRTPGAVGMKACNFASLDPAQRARDISGLGNASRADRMLWEQFLANPESVADEAEAVHARMLQEEDEPLPTSEADAAPPLGPSEIERTLRARRVQRFFRAAVLTSYDHRCTISGLAVPDLLNASHIIPWSINIERRADPRNGLCLNALYDRAFDRGLITFNDQLRVVVSRRLHVDDPPPLHRDALLGIEGQALRAPARFEPDAEALAYHRERVFCG